MEIEYTRDVGRFARSAEAFLADEPTRNVLATVLGNVQEAVHRTPIDACFALGRDPETHTAVAAAIRTPPWPMLATGFDEPADVRVLLAAWLPYDPAVPGVSAEPPTAQAIAAAWCARTGGTATSKLAEAMHQLTEVIPPSRPARGRLRRATAADRKLLIEWDRAFALEAGAGMPMEAPARVDRRLRADQHYVWDDSGPVSMLAHTATVAGTVRIGPVYTPPELRARGYATSAVAALSRQLLDAGAQRCMLFTDLANPVSNRIYASIGYVRFADWEVLDFAPVPSRSTTPTIAHA